MSHPAREPEQKSDFGTRLPDASPFPFSVPEGYFSSFKEQMMARIRDAEEGPTLMHQKGVEVKVRPLWQKHHVRSYYAYVVAAVILLLLAVGYFTYLAPSAHDAEAGYHTPIIAEMSEDEFQQFIIDDTAEDYWGTVMLQQEEAEELASYTEL